MAEKNHLPEIGFVSVNEMQRGYGLPLSMVDLLTLSARKHPRNRMGDKRGSCTQTPKTP